MRTVDDIKYILYDISESENRYVQAYLQLKNKTIISFAGDKELGQIIDNLKNDGVYSKSVIILKEFKGRMFQKCPGSPNMICCNYLLLNTCFDCLYNCNYCFLNFYKNSYGIIQFTNVDKLFDEIDEKLFGKDDMIFRIGTGEFTDSLMMDEVTGIAKNIIERATNYSNIMMEFKTKSSNVEHLLKIKNKGKTVIAWSLNTPKNILENEEDTATLDERLTAARKAQDSGYILAFHFDPIIMYPGYVEDYMLVLEKLFSSVDPHGIAWISMGCFRYAGGFKDIISHRFEDEKITTAEMFPGLDGKYRYLKKDRIEIFSKMLNKIRSYSMRPFVYLCMEDSDVWSEVFNVDYTTSEELEIDFIFGS